MRERQGWHHQDIVAAIRKRGSSLAELSRSHSYAPRTLQSALHKRWPRGHAIIASFLGVNRHQIWPQFYGPDDRPLRSQRTPKRGGAR